MFSFSDSVNTTEGFVAARMSKCHVFTETNDKDILTSIYKQTFRDYPYNANRYAFVEIIILYLNMLIIPWSTDKGFVSSRRENC